MCSLFRITYWYMMTSSLDTGLACLTLLARFHGITVDPRSLKHEYTTHQAPLSADEILLAVHSLELKAK